MFLPIPLEYKSSLCEIRSKRNEILSKGVISEIDEEYVKISAKNGDYLKLLNVNQPVKVNIYNKMGFTVLVGFVLTSTEEEMKVVDVVRIVDHERRNHFRVEVGMFAKLSPSGEFTPEEAKNEEAKVQAVFIKDLSLSGTKIETRQHFSKGTRLWIQFNLGNRIITAQCIVVRRMIDESKKFYQYGCEIEFETEADNDRLCAFLFKKQRELAMNSKA